MIEGSIGYHSPTHARRLIENIKKGATEDFYEKGAPHASKRPPGNGKARHRWLQACEPGKGESLIGYNFFFEVHLLFDCSL